MHLSQTMYFAAERHLKFEAILAATLRETRGIDRFLREDFSQRTTRADRAPTQCPSISNSRPSWPLAFTRRRYVQPLPRNPLPT
jgi:hypothetical protein